ncbi:hypothetical protein [Mesorhizobium loti]|uniref:hypothetical protein n=1 Tax=Rhizobium loti TaxID=381 RepID=UPI000423C3CB|nr:hypothetical protein [Mesorhizobium loti]
MSDQTPFVMWTATMIATRDGISQQAVSKMIKRLMETAEIPVERDARGRVAKVSLAHYDHLRDRYVNSEKSPVDRPKVPENPAALTASVSSSRDEAERQAAWLKVGRERIRHQEEIGQLARVDMLTDALAVCGREIQAIVARLPNRSDDIALAVSKEGAHGVRVLLRQIAAELNQGVSDKLAEVANGAPLHDPLIETDAEALS